MVDEVTIVNNFAVEVCKAPGIKRFNKTVAPTLEISILQLKVQ